MCLLGLYNGGPRPTLEYACPAWSTSLTVGLQSDMERVQRRAMNIIYQNTPYIYRSISECTAGFSKTETCAVM